MFRADETVTLEVGEEEHDYSIPADGEEEHEISNRQDVSTKGLSFSLDLIKGMPIADESNENGLDRPNQFIVVEVPAEENLVNSNNAQCNDIANVLPVKKLTRKRTSKPENWKRNIRKVKCQPGEGYLSAKDKTEKAKSLTVKNYCSN